MSRGGRQRVLLCLASWTTGAAGGDIHLLSFAQRWTSDVHVEVVCPRGAVPLVRRFLPDTPVHVFGAWAPTGSAALMAAEYLRRMAPAAIAARRAGVVDVAVAGSHFLPDTAAVAAARAARRAVYVHHLSLTQQRAPGVRTTLALAGEASSVAVLRRMCDVSLVVNDITITDPSRWRDVVRTDNGLDLAGFDTQRPAAPRYACSFVGRLMPTKGVRELMRVFAHVRARLPTARFAVVGTGPELEPGQQLARALGVDDAIDWLGFVDEATKRAVLASTAVFAFPSHEEGWGIAVCEALAAGTPVACYDLPAYHDVFPVGTVMVPRGDWRGLARACEALLDDPARAAAIGQAGRAHVQRYDIGTVAARELEVLLG